MTFLALLKPILAILLFILSIFLILLILVQRGRGGGLVGAFGGMGGQSAFGAKAGDVFTKVTVVIVCFWITTCIILLLALKQEANTRSSIFGGGNTSELPAATAPADSHAPVTVPTPASE